MHDVEHHLVHDDICGFARFSQFYEWICIDPPHDIGHKKDQHHFVNRWPHRTKES